MSGLTFLMSEERGIFNKEVKLNPITQTCQKEASLIQSWSWLAIIHMADWRGAAEAQPWASPMALEMLLPREDVSMAGT